MKFDFKRFFGKIRVNFNSSLEYLQTSGKTLVAAVFVSIILMAAICVLVFFAAVQGPEEVLIPDVTGKYLEEALLEMQSRELYPKINLRYSDAPGDKGKVLSQDPVAGSIAKAGRRIDLVVSSGVLVDQVGDYTGMKLTELENRLSVLFSGKQPLITLAEPMYIADPSDPGTILSQNPLPGTMLAEPVALDLVVSKGPTNEEVKIPELIDMSVSELLAQLPRTRLIFDFNSREATAEEIEEGKVGTVVAVDTTKASLPTYSHIALTLAMPKEPVKDKVYGIFSAGLPEYPFPLSMELTAFSPEGETYTLTTFTHPGGTVTIPYALPAGTELTLLVEDRVSARYMVPSVEE